MSNANSYAWWRAALAGNPAAIDANTPEPGFYETRSKSRATGEVTRSVVAYWYDANGRLRCMNGGDRVNKERAIERWPFAAKRPISEATYKAVRAGEGWPDEHPTAASDRSNAAPDDDSLEGVRERIEDLAREAEKLIAAGPAPTQVVANQAADLAERLLAREKLADQRRREEMRPHEEAAKAVDGQWRPLRDMAADCKARLKKLVVTPFLLMREAELAQAKATAQRAGLPPPGAKPAAGSTTSTSLRTVTSAVIEDYPKALAFFEAHEQVKDLIQKLANASARSGVCPAGCRIKTEKAAA